MTRINFTNPGITTTYVGRNGTGKCIGIEIIDLSDKKCPRVTIAPINSQKKVANCNIDIPIEDIEAFAAELLKIAGIVSFKLGDPEPAFPVTQMKTGNPELCYYSLNMSGRSAFVATTIDIDPDMEDADDVVKEAIKQELIDADEGMEVVCVARIDEAEYNKAMGICPKDIVVGAVVDVTAKAGDEWTGMIYRAEVTKIRGNVVTIEYSNEDEGDMCWDVDADQCKLSE